MREQKVEGWLLVGPALYGTVDGGFTRVIALNEPMKLIEGSRIQYTDDLTFVLGRPLGRV